MQYTSINQLLCVMLNPENLICSRLCTRNFRETEELEEHASRCQILLDTFDNTNNVHNYPCKAEDTVLISQMKKQKGEITCQYSLSDEVRMQSQICLILKATKFPWALYAASSLKWG